MGAIWQFEECSRVNSSIHSEPKRGLIKLPCCLINLMISQLQNGNLCWSWRMQCMPRSGQIASLSHGDACEEEQGLKKEACSQFIVAAQFRMLPAECGGLSSWLGYGIPLPMSTSLAVGTRALGSEFLLTRQYSRYPHRQDSPVLIMQT